MKVLKCLWGVRPWIPTADHMGYAPRGGPAHKTKPWGARRCSTRLARHREGILKILRDLLEYIWPHDSCNLLLLFRWSPRSNRLITLPPGLYKAGRDPYKMIANHTIANTNQQTTWVRYYVILTAWTCLTRVSIAFLSLISRYSTDQSTFVGYPSKDCRRYSVDTIRFGYNRNISLP